jgi:hypothetical protein
MSCTRIGNGFICSDIGGYMSQEIKYWNSNLEEYRATFIEYMNRASGCGVEHATMECEAHIENVGTGNMETPEYDADECMSYWDE